MKPEIKKLWVEALRSGDYPQTKYYLRCTAGYCCLGVLLSEYIKQNGDKYEWKTSAPYTEPSNPFGSGFYVPGLVDKYTGETLPYEEEFWQWHGGIDYAEQRMLTNYNDQEELTFAEIANWIDSNL